MEDASIYVLVIFKSAFGFKKILLNANNKHARKRETK